MDRPLHGSLRRQCVGRSTEAPDVVTAQLVKGLRATLFQEIGEPRAGDAAPFTTHWCLAQPVFPMSQLGPDRHPARGGFLPPGPAASWNSSIGCASAMTPSAHRAFPT